MSRPDSGGMEDRIDEAHSRQVLSGNPPRTLAYSGHTLCSVILPILLLDFPPAATSCCMAATGAGVLSERVLPALRPARRQDQIHPLLHQTG